MRFHTMLSSRSGVQIILQAIKDYGPISKRELQERTGLSWGHISQVTTRFLEEGYITVCKKEMTAGRSRELLDMNENDNYSIGVDLNYQRIRVVITDMKGRIIEGTRRNFEKSEYSDVLETLFCTLDDLTLKYKDKRLCGIGFAVQGIVDIANGISSYIGGIKNWKNVPLKKIIEDRYHAEAAIAHDPDCFMMCECNAGVLKNSNVTDAILVHYSYGLGIGMSVMINGQTYVGHQGIAGELGYAILNIRDKDGHDILERYIDKSDQEIDMEDLFCYIAGSIATANSLFNPEVIVIHIDNPDYKEAFVHTTERYLRNYSYNKTVDLRVSNLDKNANAVGAALIMVDRVIDQI